MTQQFKPCESLVTKEHPETAVAEAFRILRTNLSLRDFDGKLQVINVISAYQQEAKSIVALNLAYVYSQLGKRVLLMDLDLRAPTIHKKLRVRNKIGITDVMNRQVEFSEAVIHYDNNFDVLLSGTKTVYASELIQSESFKKYLELVRGVYDIVIIDCPPINMVTDGMITSTLADGTVMCVASNQNDKKDLIKARDTLKQFDVNMLGIVMTRMPMVKKYSNYEYGYGSEKNKKKKKK